MSNNPLGNVGSLLLNIFGQPGHDVQQYQQFTQQYDRYANPNDPTDAQNFDPQDVQNRYQHLLNSMPAALLDQAHQQAFQQLSPQDREQLAEQMYAYQSQQGQRLPPPQQLAQNPSNLGSLFFQLVQQNPALLSQLLGSVGGGALGNPLVKMLLSAVITAAVRNLAGTVLQGGSPPQQYPQPGYGGNQPQMPSGGYGNQQYSQPSQGGGYGNQQYPQPSQGGSYGNQQYSQEGQGSMPTPSRRHANQPYPQQSQGGNQEYAPQDQGSNQQYPLQGSGSSEQQPIAPGNYGGQQPPSNFNNPGNLPGGTGSMQGYGGAPMQGAQGDALGAILQGLGGLLGH